VAILLAACSSTPATQSPSAATATAAAAATAAATAPPAVSAPAAATPAPGSIGTATPSPSSSASSSAEPSAATLTPWESELLNDGPNGERTAQSALRLFAMAYGPLPGIDVPDDPGFIASGSLAARDVYAHFSDYTDEQRAAIDARLTPRTGLPTVDVGPTSVAGPRIAGVRRPAVLPEASPDEALQLVSSAVHDARVAIEAKLGLQLPGTIHVIMDSSQSHPLAGTKATFEDDLYNDCTIWFYSRIPDADPGLIRNVAAHEVFHCFEAAGLGTYTAQAWRDAPDWWVEGGAQWVGDGFGPPPVQADFWRIWLTRPDRPLFARAYDAEGFFAHLAESGTDPWTVFRAMFAAETSVPAFEASHANQDAFLGSWGSSLAREPSRGSAWDATGPYITTDKAPKGLLNVRNGTEQDVHTAAYTARLYTVLDQADVTEIGLIGHGRLSDGSKEILGQALVSAAFCTKQGGCPDTCPDGSALPEPLPTLGPDGLLALSAAGTEVSGSVTGVSFDDFCKPVGTGVWVHADRPAQPGVQPGRVIDIVSCTGPFVEMPVAFTIHGNTAQTTVKGEVTNKGVVIFHLTYDLTVTVDSAGTSMSFAGTGTANNGFVDISQPIDPLLRNLPIEPAPPGRCP
jgi:hypothetical protein